MEQDGLEGEQQAGGQGRPAHLGPSGSLLRLLRWNSNCSGKSLGYLNRIELISFIFMKVILADV